MTPKQLTQHLAALEEQMQQHARNLEFEQAAALRDQIQSLKRHAFLDA